MNTEDSGVWKPTAGEPAKKVASGCEITNLKLSANAGAAFVSVYDGVTAQDAVDANLRWVLDASTQDTDSDRFSGLVFKKGVYMVCEQGVGLNAIVCFAAKKYTV